MDGKSFVIAQKGSFINGKNKFCLLTLTHHFVVMNSSNKLRSLTSKMSESIPLIGCENQAAGAKYARFGQGAKKCLNKYVPITYNYWLPNYSFDSLLRDIIAGLTVGLMVVPQALAYATVANLPLRCGLHSAYLGCFVYCIFGGCKDVSIGPTAITSLTVSQFDRGETLYATTLALCSGTVQCLLGVLRLGFLVRFISVPVISGFVLAAAITIGFGRVKNLLGLKHVPRRP